MTPRAYLLLSLLVLPLRITAAESARPAAPAFDLKDHRIQQIVQVTAASQPAPDSKAADLSAPASSLAKPALASFPHRSSRRVHRTDCDSFHCTAYAADGRVLYSFPREQVTPPSRADQDGWLSCQQVDDLLSTFERYDKCRGVTIGLPLRAADPRLELTTRN